MTTAEPTTQPDDVPSDGDTTARLMAMGKRLRDRIAELPPQADALPEAYHRNAWELIRGLSPEIWADVVYLLLARRDQRNRDMEEQVAHLQRRNHELAREVDELTRELWAQTDPGSVAA